MSWRWLIFDYADSELPLTFWQRMRIGWRTVPIWKLPKGARRGRALFALMIAAPLFLKYPILYGYLNAVGGATAANLSQWLWIMGIVYILFLWPWFCVAYGWTCRREHRYRVRLAGYDICLNCGYWLRGLDDSVGNCPECGAEREEQRA